MDIIDTTLHMLSGGGFTLPSGIMLDFCGTTLPTGYLECDGSAVSRTTYVGLFTAIGTTWGVGDGVSTFNLPLMNRRVTVGRNGTATSVLGNTIGSTGGEEAHAQTVGELATHTHTQGAAASHTHTESYSTLLNGGLGSTGNRDVLIPGAGSSQTGATVGPNGAIANAGSGNAANVMQPSAVVMKVIKT